MNNTYSPTVENILRRLIRNRFDASTDFLMEGGNLIAVARECGFNDLADEMYSDWRSETQAAAEHAPQ